MQVYKNYFDHQSDARNSIMMITTILYSNHNYSALTFVGKYLLKCWYLHIVTVHINWSDFWYNIAQTRRKHRSFSGEYTGGIEAALFILEIPQLTSNNALHAVLEYPPPPCQRTKPSVGKPHVTNPINK
jgi:hypothetical protein